MIYKSAVGASSKTIDTESADYKQRIAFICERLRCATPVEVLIRVPSVQVKDANPVPGTDYHTDYFALKFTSPQSTEETYVDPWYCVQFPKAAVSHLAASLKLAGVDNSGPDYGEEVLQSDWSMPGSPIGPPIGDTGLHTYHFSLFRFSEGMTVMGPISGNTYRLVRAGGGPFGNTLMWQVQK